MNREQAKQLLPVIQAFAEGKAIQYQDSSGWVTTSNPMFAHDTKYRVKPEPVKFWVCHCVKTGAPLSITAISEPAKDWKSYPDLYDIREYTYEKE